MRGQNVLGQTRTVGGPKRRMPEVRAWGRRE